VRREWLPRVQHKWFIIVLDFFGNICALGRWPLILTLINNNKTGIWLVSIPFVRGETCCSLSSIKGIRAWILEVIIDIVFMGCWMLRLIIQDLWGNIMQDTVLGLAGTSYCSLETDRACLVIIKPNRLITSIDLKRWLYPLLRGIICGFIICLAVHHFC